MKHVMEYALLRAALGVFGVMPAPVASAVGGALFRSIGPLMGISRTARRNIRATFPDWDDAKVNAVTKGMWDNLGRVVAEYPHLETIAKKRTRFIHFTAEKSPVIFVSGHIGNWEVLPPALMFQQNMVMHSVYRAPNNGLVDQLIVHLRSFHGRLRSFGKNRKGLAETLKTLQDGESVGMLIDQKMNTGIETFFFGRPAMTSTAFVELAKKIGCPLVPGRIVRKPGCRFEIETFEPIAVEGRDTADVVADTHTYLERWITEYPEQWLWLHRRWKDVR